MGEHRPERRRDRRPVAGAGRRPPRPSSGRWGPGKYDPRHHAFDGTNLIPLNSPSLPIVIPPIYGLKGVGFETFTRRWADLVLEQLRGRGADGRPWQLQRSAHRPVHHADAGSRHAEAAGAAGLSIELAHAGAPKGSFDQAGRQSRQAAVPQRGGMRHLPPGAALHRRAERARRGACRSCTIRRKSAWIRRMRRGPPPGKYRTTPLRGLWQHAPYFHDGSAPDLLAVVNHYDQLFALNLTAAQKADLVEFLKSL